jgi:hypothetical protein
MQCAPSTPSPASSDESNRACSVAPSSDLSGRLAGVGSARRRLDGFVGSAATALLFLLRGAFLGQRLLRLLLGFLFLVLSLAHEDLQ